MQSTPNISSFKVTFKLPSIYLFIYFGLCWVFAGLSFSCTKQGLLSSCSARASHCGGFSCCGAQALEHMGSVVGASRLQSTGSIVVAHRLRCSPACGIFPDRGLNQCLLHWQVDSLPLSHQGNPASNIS